MLSSNMNKSDEDGTEVVLMLPLLRLLMVLIVDVVVVLAGTEMIVPFPILDTLLWFDLLLLECNEECICVE